MRKIISIICLFAQLFPMKMWAQEPYAVLSDDNTVLTFYYDNQKAARGGMSIGPFNSFKDRGWNGASETIMSVVFDTSFSGYVTLTSTACWFYGCNNLTSITGIANIKTDNVTSMGLMFDGCSSLTSLDVSGFKTDNVRNMSGMFSGCSSLISLDVSGFKTDNVWYMSGMFSRCFSLTSLDVSGFKTDNVWDMNAMFMGCSGLTSLNVSGFKTSNVTDMSEMFNGCSGLTSLDVSGFETQSVTNMHGMFSGCFGLTSLDVSGFTTGKVKDMYAMFNGCSALTSLDVSGFKTQNVTDMRYMFYGCSGLTSLDVSGFTTGKVKDMGVMFYNCSGLTSLDLNGFKTDNVKYMDMIFSGCSSLTSLDLSSFNTLNVTDMYCMFEGCSSLTSLDVSNFETDNVTNMFYMFYGCNHLQTIFAGNNWSIAKVTDSRGMFSGCTKLVGGRGTTYDYIHVDAAYAHIDGGTANPGYFTDKNATADPEPYVVLSDDNTVLTFYYDNQKTARGGMDVGPFYPSWNDNLQRITINSGWDEEREKITKVVFDASFEACTTLTSTAYWFYGMENLTSITGISNLKTDNVTNMAGMFRGCSSLTSLDVSGFNTSKVKDMLSMFNGCSGLTSLNLNNFNTSNVMNMNGMFSACSSLTSLDLSSFNTSNVQDMGCLFSLCSSLTSLGLSSFNTSNVMNMNGMFSACSSLTSLDLSGFNTSNVTDMSEMFNGCSGLTSLNLSGFNTSKVTNINGMFAACSSLTSLNLSSFNTENVTYMRSVFSGCSGLANLVLSSFNTKNVTDMSWMFSGCSSLTSLDVIGFQTDNVTNMGGMFSNCSSLTSLDVSGFQTDNVTRMDHMFEKCSGLTTIVVGNGWSTAKVAESNDMFTGCTKLVGGRGTTYNANHKDATYAHIDGGTSNPGYFTDKNAAAICETPTISRDGTSNRVIMSCATAGASIYYTTNGTTPTENNTRYTGPITVSKNCTIKAIAIKDGYESSSVATYNVNWFKVATPTFSYSNLKLSISTTTEGATIYYTTDGSTPSTTNSKAQVYSAPISLSSSATVKAIAVKADYTNSEVATYNFVQNDVTCQAPQISRSGTTNSIIMTSATSGATIYYTTDGTTPTNGSTRYSGSITVDHNQTIRAVAMKDGMFNSAQSQFTVDWFKVATPTFSYNNLQLTISTATTGATIYYTTNGSNPLEDLSRSVRYTNPIQLDADATIKAAAIKTDFNDSEIATYSFVKADYVCKQPQITRDGSSDRLMMSCEVADAVIYYTTDGSTPTTSSTRYTGPVMVAYNCTVRAIATRSDLVPSDVSEFTVDWLTASAVMVAYNNGVLTLTSTTTGAEIHYEIGGKDATKSSPLYTGPITLTDNREVRYVVYASGVEPVSGSFTPTDFTCAPVTLTYDGLNIELSTTENGASIYYTLDGSIPTISSAVYRGKTPLTDLCTVNAIAVKQYKNNSEMMQTPITYFFDGNTIRLSESDRLEDAMKWRGTENLESLSIQCQGQGVVSANDMSFLRTIKGLKLLNLKDARFVNNTVPNGAFAGMNIVSIEFPSTNITTLGNVFSGCKHLAAIIWKARTLMATTAAAAGITNPNLLLYVDNENYAPKNVRNVIVNGSARSIVLTDEEGGCYYCPQEFTAQRISYTHTYSQTTGINECRGWETIALPFDVQTVAHERNGRIAPFAAKDVEARPFWLGELSSNGFTPATEIRANTPYIISMPNNDVYGSSYILKGKVTFEAAANTTVPVTEIQTASRGDHEFTPCFDTVEATTTVYAINKYDNSDGDHPEGSMFTPNYRAVSPFEAYINVPSNGVAPRYIPIRDDSDTGIDYLTPDPFQNERVYDLTGRKVQGELKRGVYIINGNKVMVK